MTVKNLDKYAGIRKFRFGETEEEDLVGVVTGLAWTEVGGELLTVEALLVPGKGKITITGKLGDVMQESIQAANAYVRVARCSSFGLSRRCLSDGTFIFMCLKVLCPRTVRRLALA